MSVTRPASALSAGTRARCGSSNRWRRARVREADVVIPLAALVGAPICERDPTAAVTTNRDAIKTLVGMLSKDQLIVTPISNSGYGIGERGKHCTEETPLRPVSLYGRTKV